MGSSLSAQVRRVDVSEDVAAGRRYDYADAFEVQLPEPEQQPPRAWVLAGLNEAPVLVERVARWLGVDRDGSTAGGTGGWDVVESSADVIQMEQTVPLMHVVLVGRRVGNSGRRFTSLLYFTRPVPARLVWVLVGIGHRWMVRRLLVGARATPVPHRQPNAADAA